MGRDSWHRFEYEEIPPSKRDDLEAKAERVANRIVRIERQRAKRKHGRVTVTSDFDREELGRYVESPGRFVERLVAEECAGSPQDAHIVTDLVERKIWDMGGRPR